MTISVPVNDHRGFFNTSQQQWPPETLQNAKQSPLLVEAAYIRGFADLMLYLIDTYLIEAAEMLEFLDTIEGKNLGKKVRKRMKLKSFEKD